MVLTGKANPIDARTIEPKLAAVCLSVNNATPLESDKSLKLGFLT